MADSYYRGLAKGQNQDDPTLRSGATGAGASPAIGTPTNTMTPGSAQGDAGSPDQAGTGFVNLSHLLSLNGASGQQSANSFADKTRQQGSSAAGALAGAQSKFNKATNAATTDAIGIQNDVNSNGGASSSGGGQAQNGYYGALAAKAKLGYNGPGSLSDDVGYAQLQKTLSNAQARAQNSQSPDGVAAQVAKDTGLSPRQAAASAFYMGVSNKNIKNSGSQYTNLSSLLGKANDQSQAQSQAAAGYNSWSGSQLDQDEKNQEDYWQQIQKNADKQASMPTAQNQTLTGAKGNVPFDPNGNSPNPNDHTGNNDPQSSFVKQGDGIAAWKADPSGWKSGETYEDWAKKHGYL